MPMHLNAARKNARLTLVEASKELGINKNTLCNYENYVTKPSVEMGKKIASLYGLSVDDIIWSES